MSVRGAEKTADEKNKKTKTSFQVPKYVWYYNILFWKQTVFPEFVFKTCLNFFRREGSEEIRGAETSAIAASDGIRAQNWVLSG